MAKAAYRAGREHAPITDDSLSDGMRAGRRRRKNERARPVQQRAGAIGRDGSAGRRAGAGYGLVCFGIGQR